MQEEEFHSLLSDLKGNVPASLYDEIMYVGNANLKGEQNKGTFIALVNDAMRFLDESCQVVPVIRKEKIDGASAYFLNQDKADEIGFSLLSEPTEECFFDSYHDIPREVEVYRADDPLEQKGRVIKPLFLDRWPDFIIGPRRKTLGCDIAFQGDDKSTIICQHGGHVIDIQGYYREDLNETTGRIVNAIQEHNPDEVLIDGTGGLGAGPYHQLLELEFDAVTVLTLVLNNRVPRDERYNVLNVRAEMFLILQEQFRLGLVTLPPHKELIEELAWIRFFPSSDGKVKLESKEQCKKRNKRSPDFADSCALSFYGASTLEMW